MKNLRAEVYTRKQLNEALENSYIEKVYVPYSIADKSLINENERIILIPPVYLADCEDKTKKDFTVLREYGFNKALVHTIGHFELLSDMDYELYGGYRLNCVNSSSIDFYTDNGVKDIIISPELTDFQINNLIKSCSIGFLAYGHLPLMITRRCPIKNGKPCNKERCNRKLKDRMNNELDVICSENTAEILNSDVLYLADKLERFDNADFAVLKFTIENNINDIISAYVKECPPTGNDFTRGLYFRGVKG